MLDELSYLQTVDSELLMRWKLVALASVIGGLVAFGLWELVVAFWLAQLPRTVFVNNRIFFITSLVPLLTAAASAFFVYRHTSKRRKLQAVLSFLMTLVIAVASYFVGSRLLPDRLGVTAACKRQPCV
jgi:prepilin signal peptidase PulO-like enzyme (type II secretory pathway)